MKAPILKKNCLLKKDTSDDEYINSETGSSSSSEESLHDDSENQITEEEQENEEENEEEILNEDTSPPNAEWTKVTKKARQHGFTGKEELCYQSIYKSGSDVIIDESMVPFRGRVIFRQYIPGKSHKYGCKLFKLCTPDGYTLNMELYTGVGVATPPLSKTESLVVRLLANHMDIFLGEYLLQRKTYLCGTVRVNRKYLPKSVTKAKLKRGEIKALENKNGLKVFNWKDKRYVVTLSTVPEHDATLINTGKVTRTGLPIKKPQSVLDYNKCKKGVDLSDQMSSYYSPLKKSRKWYRKVALEFIAGTSIVNAWVLYNKYFAVKKMSLRAFKESIVLFYTSSIMKEKNKPGKSSMNISGKSSHCLKEAEGQKRKTRKRCRGCYEMLAANEGSKVAKIKSRKVSTYCDSCDGTPYLCLSCFNLKHN
ncbi:piggyBac transposable element-derived protein 4-like [Macrobrachium nipponense]|uniref:piggyBac transposable element-derived protein 4-like n=1 Tax=Macrobrachium nipponense TaxID=159736 RepID=UPI0030C7E849